MAVTRIKNNQITDATVVASAKLQDFSITAAKIANNLTYGSDLTISGNLTVNGQTTTIDTVSTVIEDPLIVLASNQSGEPAVDIGFIGERGTANNIAFVWDESASEFVTAFTTDLVTNTTISIASYANFHTNNANIGGNLAVTGNVSITGNVTSLNVTGNISGGNLLTPGVVTATGNVTGGNLSAGSGTIVTTGNINGANVNATSGITAGTTVVATGNVSGGNVTTAGNVVATANVVGGNLTTAGLISAGTTITATGNVTGGNLTTAGLTSTGTLSSSGNANVGNLGTAGQVTATGNITGGNLTTAGITSTNSLTASTTINATGNITGGNVTTAGQVVATGNVVGGNLTTAGLISAGTTITATGNITGGNLTTAGITSTGSLTASTTINATGNITGGNLSAGSGIISTTGNINGANVNASAGITAGTTITATGNITGGNISTAGALNVNTLETTGNVLIGGNLIVQGNITYINIDDLRVEDPIIILGTGPNGAPLTSDDGLDRGVYLEYFITGTGTANAFMGYDNSTGNMFIASNVNFTANDVVGVNSYGTLEAGNLYIQSAVSTGNITGSNLNTAGQVVATSNITGGNLTTAGITNTNSLTASTTINATGNITGGNVTTAGQVTATGNITGGNVTTAGITNTNSLTASTTINATGNITGGNLTTAGITNTNSLTASTTITATGNITGGNLSAGSGIISTTGNINGANVNATSGITAGTTVSAIGNVSGGNVTTAGQVSATGNITGGNLITAGLGSFGTTVIATGNITGGNVTTAGQVAATGNITGGNVIGVALVTGANVTATANVTGANVVGTTSGKFGNIVITGDDITDTNGRVNFNTAGADVDFAVNGDTVANVFYVDAGTGTASFGSATQTTNALVAFNTSTSVLMPVGNIAQRPATGVTGMLRFNTTTDSLEVYDNAEWSAVGVPIFTVIADEQFNGDGSTVAFALGSEQTTASCIVSINGVVQLPTISYSVTSTTLTFTEAPQSGDVIDVRQITTTTSVTSISNTPGTAIIQPSPTLAQTDITGNLIPTANVTFDLGNSTNRWRDGYFSGSSLTLGNVVMKNVAGGNSIGFFGPDGTTPATIAASSVDTTTIANGTSSVSVISSGGNIRSNVSGTTVQTISAGLVAITGDLSVTGNATLTGNILGDRIQNGTTTIDIQTPSGNANITIGATSNVAVFSTAGANITGTLGVSGNVTGGNLSGTSIVGTLTTAAQTNITSVGTLGALTVTGNVTGGNLITAGLVSLSSITKTGSNAVGNIGSSANFFNTVFAQATSALYADLAEKYIADAEYASGTVVVFGGDKEVTVTLTDSDRAVAGVVSTNPSYIMNAGLEADYVATVALTGRVPTRVTGTVRKGDLMVSAGNGVARAEADPRVGTVIGKALENHEGAEGVIEVVVGRF